MLIDLYERPYSSEASKSRAFIDRILALSGPDGGVVGGEDGISTQRPLKDGGREAWDMIRRLRQKAWQKAGLDPQMLWTEQDQIQVGVASPASDLHSRLGPFYSTPSTVPVSPASSMLAARQLPVPDRQLLEFNKVFYNLTRSQMFMNPASFHPSPLRYSYENPPAGPKPNSTSATSPSSFLQSSLSPLAMAMPANTTLTGSSITHSATSTIPTTQSQSSIRNQTFSSTNPFMDPAPQKSPPVNVPTPPSMVDPNLNFDWDQWDAVFGQHLPVADELMELDPVSGLEFADFGIPAAETGDANAGASGVYGGSGGGLPTPWATAGLGNVIPSSDYTGYC